MEEQIGGARPDAEATRREHELAEVTDRAHRLLRGAVERAREQAMAARDRARAAGPRFAPDLWDAAEAKAGEGEAILAPGDPLPFDAYSRALRKLDEAAALYQRAENQARDTVRPLQTKARQAREPAAGNPRAGTVVSTPGADIPPEAVSPAPDIPSSPSEVASPAPDIPPGAALAPIEQSAARHGDSRGPGRTGRVAIGVGALAAVAIAFFFAILYWWPASPPRESAGGSPAARKGEAIGPEQQSRSRATLAQDEAVRAGADKLAPALFAAALQKAQEGDLARDRRDAAAAQERYREAIEAFERSRDAAIRSELLARGTDEAGAVQRRAPSASSSSAATAPTTPPGRRDATLPPVRDQGTREAGQGEAVSSASSRIPQNVERARATMAAARRAAEKVAAGFFAHRRFTSAQNKEREGFSALGRSEHAEAT